MSADHRRRGHGRALKLIRERLGVSQATICVRLGIHQVTVGSWERGRAPLPENAIAAYIGLARLAGLKSIARVLEAI